MHVAARNVLTWSCTARNLLAAFDYQFDAFEDTDSDVVKAYSGFL